MTHHQCAVRAHDQRRLPVPTLAADTHRLPIHQHIETTLPHLF